MTFRTIDTDMASVGAATESDITRTSAARRARSKRQTNQVNEHKYLGD